MPRSPVLINNLSFYIGPFASGTFMQLTSAALIYTNGLSGAISGKPFPDPEAIRLFTYLFILGTGI